MQVENFTEFRCLSLRLYQGEAQVEGEGVVLAILDSLRLGTAVIITIMKRRIEEKNVM
jgi:hypothetical protein